MWTVTMESGFGEVLAVAMAGALSVCEAAAVLYPIWHWF